MTENKVAPTNRIFQHSSSVTFLALSSDSNLVLSVTGSVIHIWLAATGKKVADLNEHTAKVNNCVFSADNKTFFSCSDDMKIKQWNWMRASCIHTFEGHNGVIYSMDLTVFRRTEMLASGGIDRLLRIWNVDKRKLVSHLRVPDSVLSLSFSDDGRLLACGFANHNISIFVTSSGHEGMVLKGHTGPVRSVKFCSDEDKLFSLSEDQSMRIWDTKAVKAQNMSEKFEPGQKQKVKLYKEIKTSHTDSVTSADITADLSTIVTASSDKTMKVIDVENKKVLSTFHGHQAGINCVKFSPEGDNIVTGSKDNTVRIWPYHAGFSSQSIIFRAKLLFSISMYFLDQFTDAYIAYLLFLEIDTQLYWFIVTVFFIYFQTFILIALEIFEGTAKWWKIILNLLQLRFPFEAIASFCGKYAGTKGLRYSHTYELIKLLEPAFESTPQLFIQLYMLILFADTSEGQSVRLLSIGMSILSISYSLATNPAFVEFSTIEEKLVTLCYRLFELFSRAFVLVTFGYLYDILVFPVVAAEFFFLALISRTFTKYSVPKDESNPDKPGCCSVFLNQHIKPFLTHLLVELLNICALNVGPTYFNAENFVEWDRSFRRDFIGVGLTFPGSTIRLTFRVLVHLGCFVACIYAEEWGFVSFLTDEQSVLISNFTWIAGFCHVCMICFYAFLFVICRPIRPKVGKSAADRLNKIDRLRATESEKELAGLTINPMVSPSSSPPDSLRSTPVFDGRSPSPQPNSIELSQRKQMHGTPQNSQKIHHVSSLTVSSLNEPRSVVHNKAFSEAKLPTAQRIFE